VRTTPNSGLSRREMIKQSGAITVASALAGIVLPQVHAAENNTIQLALVGCGGRGTGAAGDALSTQSGPTKLIAMADVFPQRLSSSYRRIQRPFKEKVDVPEDRRFIGFDAYRKAMDCLRPGDVVILTTPPAFRWVHFTYAIAKGLNVFMEKPVAVDGPTARKMLKLGEESQKRNMKVGVGLMCRHCVVRHELFDRIKSGQIGDLLLLQAYRMGGSAGRSAFAGPNRDNISELLYQVRYFHSFLWASGGLYSDYLIHNIDECCWMKDAWPVQAKASGGRQYRRNAIDQNFDHYSVEYTFPDGAKLLLQSRQITGCQTEFASYAHGSKGSAVISTAGHTPARCRLYKGQNFVKNDLVWQFGKEEPNPYRVEWEDLMKAIRQDQPYHEVKRGVEASLVTAMGRMASHTGRIVTRDQMLACDHEFAPEVDRLAMDSPAPLRAESDGKYPVPEPGIKTKREF
jgi:predicted dehydrogenase